MNNSLKINWLSSLYSDGSPMFLKPSNPDVGDKVSIKIRAFKESPIQKIFLRIAPDGEEFLLPMKVFKTDNIFRWWSIKIELTSILFFYRFKILTDDQIIWYNQEGWYDFTPPDDLDFKIVVAYESPDWLKTAVFYQIFPDTFCDGNPENNVQDGEYSYLGYPTKARKWGKKPGSWKKYKNLDFFGGDLAGIRTKIKYLKKLGINALYLNPIFEAPTNHKYDTTDYFKIDPHFGTNDEFAQLSQKLHQNGIRIILDGVFNHCGISCNWFKDACINFENPFRKFFIFEDYPKKFLSWMGTKILPVLDFTSEAVRKIVYKDENSVAKFWLKSPYNIDGWRLDVANMLGRQGKTQIFKDVWREFRSEVKKINPQAYVVAEHFYDPSPLLQGDMFDGAQNYAGFNQPLRQVFSGMDLHGNKGQLGFDGFERQIRSFFSRISWQVALNRFNFINSHDITRLSVIAKDERQIKLAAILLFTFPGIPCIYYGDEIGLGGHGHSVESNRTCMIWDKNQWDKDLWDFYKKLIELRKKSKALQGGSFQTLVADKNIYAFARFTSRQIYITAINNGDSTREVKMPVKLVGMKNGDILQDVISGERFEVDENAVVVVNLAAYEGVILE